MELLRQNAQLKEFQSLIPNQTMMFWVRLTWTTLQTGLLITRNRRPRLMLPLLKLSKKLKLKWMLKKMLRVMHQSLHPLFNTARPHKLNHLCSLHHTSEKITMTKLPRLKLLMLLMIRKLRQMRPHNQIFPREPFQPYPKKDHSTRIMTRHQPDSYHQSKIMDNLSAKLTWITLLTLKQIECFQPTRPMRLRRRLNPSSKKSQRLPKKHQKKQTRLPKKH